MKKMYQFQPKELSTERIKDCEEFIKTSITMTLDSYLDFYHKNIGYCGGMIKDFYTLPKTDLHKEFKEKICIPHRALRIKQEEEYRRQNFIENSKKCEHENRERCDGKYKIINKIETSDSDVLVIGIPYEVLEAGKGYQAKFAYSTTIMEQSSPNLYQKIEDNMLWFKRD